MTGLIGRGGFGAVYLAEQLHLGNVPCALKEMFADPSISPVQCQQNAVQFQFEASVLARLSHPMLPKVTDFFSEGGRYYLAMEYVEGETLEERLQLILAATRFFYLADGLAGTAAAILRMKRGNMYS
ncbi:MAG: hypothetical protein B6D41_00335 [Chloroflexi bacterium UTCFX4]|nr:MAG: hypothetical protein B6D41_00335 [Chloroflexi bacterium UTCFX4]